MAAHDIIMAAAGGSTAATYIEDVFSTWLYTGNGSTQTITNGIDLAGKGGLVWIKNRNGTNDNVLQDTVTGANKYLISDATVAQSTLAGINFAFNSSGFSMNNAYGGWNSNAGPQTYASWTFRKQPKFFDVVTGTTDSSGNAIFNHNLGSDPGMVIIKLSGAASLWWVYHKSLGSSKYLLLNSTAAAATWDPGLGITTSSTSVNALIGTSASKTFVAYLFAHNAGGFGLTGTDNVISCGSWTGSGSPQDVYLGYEPQWVLLKRTDTTGDWVIIDTMRGFTVSNSGGGGVADPVLKPNTADAEDSNFNWVDLNSTGFRTSGTGTGTYIYIAIRRGPMKTPTSGTSVYNAALVNSSNSTQSVDAGFPVDLVIKDYRNLATGAMWFDRLRGITTSTNPRLISAQTSAESGASDVNGAYQTGVTEAGIGTGYTSVDWFLQRAPGFFDEVCYTGTGAARTVTHNLGVAPQFMVIKSRSNGSYYWPVYIANYGTQAAFALNETGGNKGPSTSWWNDTAPTSADFTVGSAVQTNASGQTYVAWLFASCPGVSSVGTYSGNGSTQTINCGFASGARFVLIKRVSSTGNWVVWDTARGMVAGTDPQLQLNTTNAETNANWVYTTTGGFQLVTSNADVNANGSVYFYMAIA